MGFSGFLQSGSWFSLSCSHAPREDATIRSQSSWASGTVHYILNMSIEVSLVLIVLWSRLGSWAGRSSRASYVLMVLLFSAVPFSQRKLSIHFSLQQTYNIFQLNHVEAVMSVSADLSGEWHLIAASLPSCSPFLLEVPTTINFMRH